MKKTFLIIIILCLAGAVVFSAAGCNDILSIFAVSDAPGDYTFEDVCEKLVETETFDSDIFCTLALTKDETTYNYTSSINYTLDKVSEKNVVCLYSITAYPDSVCYIIDGDMLKIEDTTVIEATMSDLYPSPSYWTNNDDVPDIGAAKAIHNSINILYLNISSMAYEAVTAPAGSLGFQINFDEASLVLASTALDENGFFNDMTACVVTIITDNTTKLPISIEITASGSTVISVTTDTTTTDYTYNFNVYYKISLKSYDKENPLQYPPEIITYLESLE